MAILLSSQLLSIVLLIWCLQLFSWLEKKFWCWVNPCKSTFLLSKKSKDICFCFFFPGCFHGEEMSSHLKESLICQRLDLLNWTIDHNKDYAVILSSYETRHAPELLKSQVLLLPMWETRSFLNACLCELVLFVSWSRWYFMRTFSACVQRCKQKVKIHLTFPLASIA